MYTMCMNKDMDVDNKDVISEKACSGLIEFHVSDEVVGSGFSDSISGVLYVTSCTKMLVSIDNDMVEMTAAELHKSLLDSFYGSVKMKIWVFGWGRNIRKHCNQSEVIELGIANVDDNVQNKEVDVYSTEEGWHPLVMLNKELSIFV